MQPRIVMLAGPNGAGKSTFFSSHLADKDLPFVNADNIALELGLGAYEAASLAQEIRERLVHEKRSFITETVFSDPAGAKLAFLRAAVGAGFAVTLIYIGLESAEASWARVKARVERGGHDVPADKVMSRYQRTLNNLEAAIRELPQVIVYDNSSFECPYRFLAEFRSGKVHERTKGKIPGWARKVLGKRLA